MKFFIYCQDQQFGPYSIEEVKAYLFEGRLASTDLVWYEGAPDWMPLHEVPGLAGSKLLLAARPPGTARADLMPIPEAINSAAQSRPSWREKAVILLLMAGKALLLVAGKALLLVGGILLGFMLLMLLVAYLVDPSTLLAVLGCLFLLLFVALLFVLACLVERLLPPPRVKRAPCQCCLRTTLLIEAKLECRTATSHETLKGWLCERCIARTFWKYSALTLLFGWWRLTSFFIAPLVLKENLEMYARSLRAPIK